MNALTTITQPTMSSREIAELTGKRHDNVMRDVKHLLSALGENLLRFEAVLPDSYGRPQPAFALPKRETLILVSGYDPVMRAKIIDRWMELERQAAQPTMPAIPKTFAEALRLAADQAEQLAAQAVQLERQAPLVKVGERVAAHKHTLGQIVRTLPGVNTVGIKKDLYKAGYLYKFPATGDYRVYHQHRDLFIEQFSEGGGKFDIIPTAKGRAVLLDLYSTGRLTMRKGQAIDTSASIAFN